MARVKHPYRFRAFRTLGFLLYMETPVLIRHADGSIEIPSLSAFSHRIHVADQKYIRDDLRNLLTLGLLESAELGHNKAVVKVKEPVGFSREQRC